MSTAIILTGSDRYASRWHDHAATSQRVAEILAEVGIDARLRGTHPRAFGDLGLVDLLIVDAGSCARSPDDASDDEWAVAHARLAEYVSRGGALLVLHNGVGTFDDLPAWSNWIGGSWVDGISMHPPIGETTITPREIDHPIVNGLGPVTVFDELYSHLGRADDNTVLVFHRYDDQKQPLVWTRDKPTGRVVVDALGHDVRSYDSEGRVRLLKREALWVMSAEPGTIQAI
jgi:type 1 glutamine amidotransferase